MCNCKQRIMSSTASSAVIDSQLRITPTDILNPDNEQAIKILVTSSTPTAGAALPVSLFLNSAAVPVYDRFGNLVYGNQIYKGIILKGYFGNNGSDGNHFQLIKLPVRYFINGE